MPSSVRPAASVVLVREDGRVLWVRRGEKLRKIHETATAMTMPNSRPAIGANRMNAMVEGSVLRPHSHTSAGQ